MGRPPKSRKSHELAGWPGHRSKAERDRPELDPVGDLGDCPEHIKGVAAMEWRRLAPELVAKGMLTIVDRATLEAYCLSYERWRQAEGILKKESLLKGKRINPAFTLVQRCVEQMHSLAAKLGRTRLVASAPTKSDPDDEFLKGNLE